MPFIRAISSLLIFAAVAGSSAVAGQKSVMGEKALLQASMQKHIDDHLIDGAYLHLNRETGAVRELHPVEAHPMILKMGEFFILCSHFRGKNGKETTVDFYLARRGNSFVVFDAAIDDRKPLHDLMKAGKVSRLN